jgi:adenosine deaminase
MKDICRRMPKAELHLHLDGALSPGIAAGLLRKMGGECAPLSYRELYERLVISENLASQAELLAYFDLPGRLLHTEEGLREVTRSLLLEKAADHVRYCELRWAPALHCAKGLSPARVVETVADECRLVTGATGQTVRLIAVGMRTLPLAQNLAMLEEIAPLAGRLIAAADYAGPEAKSPDAQDQLAFFKRARELGLYVTLHCGELPNSAPRLRAAVEAIGPERIAHGAGAAQDPALCEMLRDRDIMLDLCPTSNIQAGLYPDHKAYPLKRLAELRVPVSISTDDSVLSDLALSDEYIRLLEAGLIDLKALWRLNLDALSHAFLEEAEKQRLLAEFEDWAAGIKELR